MNTQIMMTDLEAAINFWRQQKPSIGEEMRLCSEASALANHYALMIVRHQASIEISSLDPRALEAMQIWRQSTATTK